MALLAIAYPTLSQADTQWIQTLRAQHDPNYAIVAPHFTLIFPTFDRAPQPFGAHVRVTVQGQPRINFALRCALVVKDALREQTHTFLVPDEGFSDLVKLHDQLYTNWLADQMRLDIPYIPHITVATSPDPTVCKRIADAINNEPFTISGSIDLIDIVQFTNRTVTTMEQIALV